MGVTVDHSKFDAALARMLALSKREFRTVAEEQMRGIMRTIIAITPPGHATEGGVAKHADAIGRAKILTDIKSLYGTSSEAYDLIKAKDPDIAKGFWKKFKQGNIKEAREIFQAQTGKGLYEFDGGALHRRMKTKRRWHGTRRAPVFYVSKKKPLDEYIKLIQSRVGWLASGWNNAALELGIQPPKWVLRHPGPGSVEVEVTNEMVRIKAVNSVRYASEVGDMERRIQYALRKQTEAMDRRVRSAMERVAKEAGFKI